MKIKENKGALTLGLFLLLCLTLLAAGWTNAQVSANCNQKTVSVSTHYSTNGNGPDWFYKLTTGDCEKTVNWNSDTDFDEAREGVKEAEKSVKSIELEGIVDLSDVPYIDGEKLERSINESMKKTEKQLAKIDFSGIIESVDKLEAKAEKFEKVEAALIKDGLVKEDEAFKFKLRESEMTIDGQKQSTETFQKYKALVEGEELPIEFKKSDKSPWDCD